MLPTRKHMSKKAVPDLYIVTRQSVKSQISTAESFAATMDISSSSTMEPYFSYTLHHISEDWQLKIIVWRCWICHKPYRNQHTVAEALESIIESWHLNSEQQICITTDNGSNMVAAITKLGWTHLSCFGYNLNLAVTNAIKKEDRITRAVGVCKKVVQHFAHSWKKGIALRRHKLQKVSSSYTCQWLPY